MHSYCNIDEFNIDEIIVEGIKISVCLYAYMIIIKYIFNRQMKQNTTAPPLSRPNVGLRNIGNTDYLSAGIQCLYHTPQLTQYFINGSYEKQINIANPLGTKGEIVNAYANLIKQAWKSPNSALQPTQLKKVIGNCHPMFAGYQAHDCVQFLSYFIDSLHEDLNRILKKPMTDPVQTQNRPDKEVAYETWKVYLKRNQSIITDLMTGQLKSLIICQKCKCQSINFDPFIIPSLPIPEANAIVTLSQCLSFQKQPTISSDQDWYCPKCKDFRKYTQTRQIYKAPHILVMKLERVKKQANKKYKQQQKVILPAEINLKQFVLDPEPISSYTQSLQNQNQLCSSQFIPKSLTTDPIYELYAVNEHRGSMDGGHYVSYAKNEGKWWLFDDSYFKQVDEKQVLNAQAYAVFYRRKP